MKVGQLKTCKSWPCALTEYACACTCVKIFFLLNYSSECHWDSCVDRVALTRSVLNRSFSEGICSQTEKREREREFWIESSLEQVKPILLIFAFGSSEKCHFIPLQPSENSFIWPLASDHNNRWLSVLLPICFLAFLGTHLTFVFYWKKIY